MVVLEGSGKSRPLVMGIINATPDSFHESSREGDVERAMKMIQKAQIGLTLAANLRGQGPILFL